MGGGRDAAEEGHLGRKKGSQKVCITFQLRVEAVILGK